MSSLHRRNRILFSALFALAFLGLCSLLPVWEVLVGFKVGPDGERKGRWVEETGSLWKVLELLPAEWDEIHDTAGFWHQYKNNVTWLIVLLVIGFWSGWFLSKRMRFASAGRDN